MNIKKLAQIPILASTVDNTIRNAFIDIHQRINSLIGITPSDLGAAGTTHAANHKTGGSDVLTAVDIGAAAIDHTHDTVITWVAKAGKSWYRKYPDGWCEQGGNPNVLITSQGYYAVTFPVPFTIVAYVNGIIVSDYSFAYNTLSLTGFHAVNSSALTRTLLNWEAKGRWK